jgi:uncharacterized protein with PIN domain
VQLDSSDAHRSAGHGRQVRPDPPRHRAQRLPTARASFTLSHRAQHRLWCDPGPLAITVVPMTAEAATYARGAYRLYGKGGGAITRVLNPGDGRSYGVALGRGVASLYKGEDFRQAPIAAAAC